MSQAAFLRSFDSAAFAGFLASGLADAARYLSPAALEAIAAHDPEDPDAPPLPEPQPCTVLVDRNVADFGDDGAPVNVGRIRVTFLGAEVSPERQGLVTLLDDAGNEAETFELAQRVATDESVRAWWVKEVDDA
jgi:hypothetical protein